MAEPLPVPPALTALPPAWTLRERVEQPVRYVNQAGGEDLAVITLVFEPHKGATFFQFRAELAQIAGEHQAFHGEAPHASELEGLVTSVFSGVTEAIQEQHTHGIAVGYLTATLTHLMVHPVGSTQSACLRAGSLAVQRGLQQANLELTCACLTPRSVTLLKEYVRLGIDPQRGRYAEVSIEQCAQCGRYWLHYHYEWEAFSRSGRWYRGVLTKEQKRSVTAPTAASVLEALPWYLAGGSFFDGNVHRSSGPLRD